MPLFAPIYRRVSVLLFAIIFSTSLFLSVISFAQLNLAYRLLQGYVLSTDAPVNKGKPTLFMIDQADEFSQIVKPATTGRRPAVPNFTKDMVVGVALPATTKPPKLSISRVFVRDSILTIRYIRMKDTTSMADRPTGNGQSSTSNPFLLVAVPKQTVLKTRLIENGKVVLTVRKREDTPD